MDPNLLTPEQVALAPALVPHGDDRQFHERPVSGANCFSPGSNGLGLYYSEGPPDQTPPSLSASLPATPASWTSQTVSHGLHLQTVDAKPPWTPSTFDGVTPLTETGMAWPESLLLHNPDGSCHLASPPMQYHPETALSAPDLSGQRCSVSSSYPTASEDFGSDGGGPSYLTQRGDRGDCWPELNTFPSLTVSAPLESMSSEMPGISPGGSTVIDLYAFETMSYSCSSSALSSPVSQPAAPPKGKARAKSLPTRPTDGQGSYVSGRRVRKRRAKSATSGGNFICHICGLACSRNTNLQKHLNTHQRERIKDFVCTLLNDEEQQCDKRFERKADLRRHQKAVSLNTPNLLNIRC